MRKFLSGLIDRWLERKYPKKPHGQIEAEVNARHQAIGRSAALLTAGLPPDDPGICFDGFECERREPGYS